MTAKDIGKKLSIFPNAVYRAAKQLLELGMVEEVRQYPIKYRAKKSDEVIELYSSMIRQNFQEVFGFGGRRTALPNSLQLKFIRTRKELFENVTRDVQQAKSSADLIVSGFEVPAEIILSYKRAIERGVGIRILVQRLDEISEKMFQNWQKMGVEVKYYPNMEARIIIIDQSIVYFTSYSLKAKQEAIGIRFAHVPYAKLMDEVFEQRWNMAREIKRVFAPRSQGVI